ncbi:thiamine phosphate synthase [Anaeromicropila populeti]|nr:thiamine phosphate synthase [Anaeromicropila populeti]
MNNQKLLVDYSLYLCTDQGLMSTSTLEEAVEEAILGGCTVIQLREKDCSSKDFYELALRIKKITKKYKVPLIINDRVDIALAVDAEGVHVGQNDLPARVVRQILGPDKIIGVSTARVEEAERAAAEGADYIGVGAMYETATKNNTRPVSKEELLRIRNAVTIPIVVIGGINKERIQDFHETKINGIAVVSAVISQKNIRMAASELKERFLKL